MDEVGLIIVSIEKAAILSLNPSVVSTAGSWSPKGCAWAGGIPGVIGVKAIHLQNRMSEEAL